MSRIYFLIFLLILYVLIDFYVFSVVRALMSESTLVWKRIVYIGYWLFTTAAVVGVLLYNQLDPHIFKGLRLFITSFFFINLVAKVFSTLVIFGDDLRRGIVYLSQFFTSPESRTIPGRSEFMGKAALIAGAVPLTSFSFGIISGAHDYRVRTKTIISTNLPKSFKIDGSRYDQK